jgi:ADP-ribose pyrophosphatase
VTEQEEIVWQGKYIAAKRKGKWEYVSRTRGISAAVILAVCEGKVILVEQYRAPLDSKCIELPAGLVGDEEEGEAVETAALRELEEETGFRAERVVNLGRFHASPGMSSEGFTLLKAEGLAKIGDGGGIEGEEIVVHLVPIADVPDFLERKRSEGAAVDVKLLLLLGRKFI